MKRLIAIGCILALGLAAGTAAADDEGARAAMHRGVAAFGRGDAEAALAEYESAKKLAPEANAPCLYAAEALIQLQRWGLAIENLETYLQKNPSVSDAEDVRARIAKLRAERLPGRLRVSVDAPSATISIDGKPSGGPATFELSPGKHTVEAQAPNRRPQTSEIVVVGDVEVPLTFDLVAGDPIDTTPKPPPATSSGIGGGRSVGAARSPWCS